MTVDQKPRLVKARAMFLAAVALFCIAAVVAPASALGFLLSGKVVEEGTANPIGEATVALGDRVTYSDVEGNFAFDHIADPGSFLLTATADNYSDYGQRVVIDAQTTTHDIVLSSTGEYLGSADAEYKVTITHPETGYAHITCRFKHVTPNQMVKLDMHYVFDDLLSIENISVKNEAGTPLPFHLNIRQDHLIWYELTIESSPYNQLIIDYDIHYVTICHDGNIDCYHAYIGDSYGVFENMNHILFYGASTYDVNGPTTGVEFVLPPGWVASTPWKKIGNYYVDHTPNIIYAAPGVGRFELHRLDLGGVNVIVGIHENAHQFAPIPEKWPITIASFEKGIAAANQINPFDSDHSVVVGIPPLGPSEGAINSVYSPADNFPSSFSNLAGMDDIGWCEKWWACAILDYFGEIVLYSSGFYSKSQYKRLIEEHKALYLIDIYGTDKDHPISYFEQQVVLDSELKHTADLKTKLFAYCLDSEIRRVTSGARTLTDVMVHWRRHLNYLDWSTSDAIGLLNGLTGYDFNAFFNNYFFDDARLPVDTEWFFGQDHPSADAGSDREVIAGQIVQLDASNSIHPEQAVAAFKWTQINGPAVVLDDDAAIKPTFRAPDMANSTTGSVRVDFELQITYLGNLWDSDDVNIEVKRKDGPEPDTTPPTVESISPVANAVDVPVGSSISATFSEPIDPTSIGAFSFLVDNGLSGTVGYDPGSMSATFEPSSALSPATTFMVTITTAVKDLAGNPLPENYSWWFTTSPGADTGASIDSGDSDGSGGCFVNSIAN